MSTSIITPCLWFDDDAEAAFEFYGSIFGDVRVIESSRYPEGAPMPAGTLLAATYELAGQRVMVINGGPSNQLTDAFSFMVRAETQADIDRLWELLTADGGEPGPCGWLKDRFGVSWQVVPPILAQFLGDPDAEKSGRTMQAMFGMTKLDIAALQAAHDGAGSTSGA